MPAVTVDSILALPRIPDPDRASTVERPVLAITTAPKGVEGEGFPVRRAFYGLDQRHLDPFIHMDQMGEVEYGPGEPKGTNWHPHRGFETVTYMIDGTFQHQDSHGGGGVINDGATQWMTAGAHHRRGHRRARRPGVDAHADHDGARHRAARSAGVPAVAAGVQRAGVRP